MTDRDPRGSRWQLTDRGRAALRNTEDADRAQGGLFTLTPMEKAFMRECADWWGDGCNCVACQLLDKQQAGRISAESARELLRILCDRVNGQHGDGVYLDDGAQLGVARRKDPAV